MKNYKEMAYYKSTGIWDRHRQTKLSQIVGDTHDELQRELEEWQAGYDDQFMKYPFDFDWAAFNQQGLRIKNMIQTVAPDCIEVYYVASDDREFLLHDSCSLEQVMYNSRSQPNSSASCL